MSASGKTWLNNNPPSVEDDDLNGFNLENNNLIVGSGQSLSTSDRQQTHKAVSAYAAGGRYYTDSGAANAYVLTPVGQKVAPEAYFDGAAFDFIPGSTNTGASTANPGSLGVKNIFFKGSALAGGELTAGSIATVRYSSGDDRLNLEFRSLANEPFTKIKAAATTKTADVTYADDPHLAGFNLAAGAVYEVKMFLYAEQTDGGYRIKFTFDNAPQASWRSATGVRSGGAAGITNSERLTTEYIYSIVDTEEVAITFAGFVRTHATLASVMDMQWAQSVLDTSSVLHQGSYLTVTRIG